MSQELFLNVRLKPDKNDLREIGRMAGNAAKGAGEEGAQKRTKASEQESQAIKQTNVQLDQLSRRYMNAQVAIEELSRAKQQYKTQLDELRTKKRQDGFLTEENQRREIAITTAYKDTSSQLNKKRRELIDLNAATNASSGSYEQMRLRMKELSRAMRNMSDATGKNKAEFQTLNKEYLQLNNKVKQIDKSMGNHQRNVGNYEDSIRGAANAIAVFQGPLGPIAGRINSFATVVSNFALVQKKATTATITWGVALKALAMASGIGLLLVAMSSLVSFFRRTERGQEALRVGTAALTTVFDTLAESGIAMGEFIYESFKLLKKEPREFGNAILEYLAPPIQWIGSLFESVQEAGQRAFNDPLGAIQSVGEAIKNYVITRLKGVVDVLSAVQKGMGALWERDWEKAKEAAGEAAEAFRESMNVIPGTSGAVRTTFEFLTKSFDEVREGASKFSEEIHNNANEAAGLEVRMNAVLRAERELGVERAKVNALVQQSRDFARQETNSFDEREAAIREAMEANKELAKNEITIAQERLDVIREQNAITESNAQDKQAAADAEAELARVQQQQATVNLRLLRELQGVQRERIDQMRRERQMQADFDLGQQQLKADQEVEMLRRRNRDIEALELEKEQIGIGSERRIAERRQNLIDQGHSEEIASKLAQQEEELQIERETAEAENKIIKAKEQYKQELIDASLNAAFQAAEIAFGDNKATQLGQTVIETLRGMQKAKAENPGPLGWALAASIGLSGAKTVQKIVKTERGDKDAGSSDSGVDISEQFKFVDTQENQANRILAGDVAGQIDSPPDAVTVKINVIDDEKLAGMVREGNKALSGRGATIKTGR